MEPIISLSIGTGLVVSFFFSEMLGLTAGGMVVPGYVALYLDRPVLVVLTLAISYLTYLIVSSFSAVMIVYGRRRTVMMILVGFALGSTLRWFAPMELPGLTAEFTVIGYIIPGLIAIWIDRQGVIESFSVLIIASVIVRMILILVTQGELRL